MKNCVSALLALCLLLTGCQQKPELAVFLLMGQSNMEGRSYGGTTGKLPSDEEILVLSWDSTWKIASTPLHDRGEGPGMSFALGLKEQGFKSSIGLVPLAVGGSGIERWSKGGDLYQQTMNTATNLPSGNIAGVLWHQGETDTETTRQALDYEINLHQLIEDIRRDLNQPDLPFIVGELGHWLYERDDRRESALEINRALFELPEKIPFTAFVSAESLSNSDTWHFSVEDIRILGKRYAEAYVQFVD